MTGDEMNRIRQQAGLSISQLGRFLYYSDTAKLRDMCGGYKPISGPIRRVMELIDSGILDSALMEFRVPRAED